MKKIITLFAAACAFVAYADDVEYASIGTGYFQDGLVLTAMGVSSEAWAVDVEQCTTDENLYRVPNPYMAEACPFDWGALGASFDKEAADEYIYIDATKPTAVVWEKFATGIVSPTGNDLYILVDSRYKTNSYLEDGALITEPYYTYFYDGDNWGYFSNVVYLPGTVVEKWTKVQDAKYTDGLWSMYTETEAQTWTVGIYKSNYETKANLIRVENPYTAATCPLDFGDALTGISPDQYWELDLSNPEAVKQTTDYFSTGIVTTVVGGTNYPLFLQQAESATMVDNVITFPADALVVWYLYDSSNTTPINATILDLNGTTGIASVAADGAGEAEYYNLQGIRTANPTPGIYIVKQGSKATKQVIR